MRHVVLSEDGITLAENAQHRLLAVVYFPESPRDQEQGLFIARMEQDAFLREGQENYQPSEILQAASKMLANRAAQLYAVGLIALAYIWLSGMPYRPSLNRASIIVSYSAGEFNKITYRLGLDPTGQEKAKSVTSDPATLERIFRKYRSVAHICAAYVSAASYLDNRHIWDDVPAVTEIQVQTAVSFQNALEKITDTSQWEIWELKKHYPMSLSGTPMLHPDGALEYWLKSG